MSGAADLARRLAREAEAVCRYYLSHGRRQGNYWLVGDVQNTPGRSLYVRLHGPDHGPGAAGKWTDAATGGRGDLLDLIGQNRGLDHLGRVMDEARAFLSLPHDPIPDCHWRRPWLTTVAAARRLFAAGVPVPGTLAESYLRHRGITAPADWPSLRFHPALPYREHDHAPRQTWPALLAAVTDHDGRITGIQRTWLDPATAMKAPLDDPRRALGHLLGNGVRFGALEAAAILVVGEGIETMLALKSVLPSLPMVAALSANHLAALALPPSLHRLYIARDNDTAGLKAAKKLCKRADAAIEVRDLVPVYGDFNIDLCRLGSIGLLQHLAGQLVPQDLARFGPPA